MYTAVEEKKIKNKKPLENMVLSFLSDILVGVSELKMKMT